MKKITLALAILLSFVALNAQTTDVITGLGGPIGLQFNGNDLYVTESGSNKLSKIDVSATTPTAVEVTTGHSLPIGMILNGNDLYLVEFSGKKYQR